MKNKYFLWASISCFLLSLALPVQYDLSESLKDFNYSHSVGLFYLICGYITIVDSKVDFICWLGNFTILLTWIFFWKATLSKILSVIAFLQMILYGLDLILRIELIDVINYEAIPIGYLFWLASPIFMLLYHFYPIKNNNSESQI